MTIDSGLTNGADNTVTKTRVQRQYIVLGRCKYENNPSKS